MVQFDNQYKQVKLKVVFYGPALGGKTTSLQHIHRVTDPQRRTKLYALATAADRTLFFDLLAIDLGRVRGYRLTLQLYTVPGQVQYNATRRAVLAGADGVVLVADSQRSQAQANVESLANLADNLRANGLDPKSIPTVLLYNKRDLPDVLPRVELERAINAAGNPAFEGVALTGQGVMEAFAAVTEATVRAVADRLGLSAQPEALERLVANVRSAMKPYLPQRGDPAAEAPVVLRSDVGASLQSSDELVAEAVRANMAMTESNTRLDRLTTELERRVTQLRLINEFGRLMSLAREPEEVTSSFLDRLLGDLRVGCGSLRLADDSGSLVEVLRRGLAVDPVLRPTGNGRSLAEVVAANRVPVLVRVDERDTGDTALSGWTDEISALGLAAGMAVPLVAQDRVLGLVTCYSDVARGSFEDSELDLAAVLATNAAAALANARSWRSLEQLNRNLEEMVAARTRDLELSLARTRSLAAELEERNAALEAANRQLRELETLKSDLLNRIAHELNTPVTSIQTAARILSRHDEVPPDKAVKFVEIITQESQRLADLIASALQAVVLGVPEGTAAAGAGDHRRPAQAGAGAAARRNGPAVARGPGQGRGRPRQRHRRRRAARVGGARDREERGRVQPGRRQRDDRRAAGAARRRHVRRGARRRHRRRHPGRRPAPRDRAVLAGRQRPDRQAARPRPRPRRRPPGGGEPRWCAGDRVVGGRQGDERGPVAAGGAAGGRVAGMPRVSR